MTRGRAPLGDAASGDGLPAILGVVSDAPMSGRVRRGVVWTAGSRLVVQVMQVGATAVLARLLSPADYGLSALVAVVTGFAAILVDLGIPAAVIRCRDLDARYLSTAFWLNSGVGLAMAGLVCAAAVPTAAFFDQPELVGLMLLSSLTFVLSLNAVHVAVLQRALAFARISRMTLLTTLVGLVASVVAAAAGLGAVSLVLGPVAERATSVVQVWLAVRWVPRRTFSRAAARDIWTFGRGLTGSNVLTYWVNSADRFLIGRLVTVTDLGYYNRASNLMMLPIQQTTRTLSGVFYPALASMAGDAVRLRGAWLRLVRASWVVGLPVGLGLVLTSDVLVEVLYGPGWEPVVPVLVVLSVAVPFLVLGVTAGPAYQALGRTGLQFRVGLVTAALALVALGVGIRWGVLGVAVAVVVRAVLGVSLSLGVLLPLLGVRPARLLAALWRGLLAGAVMAAAVWGAGILAAGFPSAAVLGVQAVVGGLVYGSLVWWLERDIIGDLLGRRRTGRAGPAPAVAPTKDAA